MTVGEKRERNLSRDGNMLLLSTYRSSVMHDGRQVVFYSQIINELGINDVEVSLGSLGNDVPVDVNVEVPVSPLLDMEQPNGMAYLMSQVTHL